MISNRADAPGLVRATERGIAARAIPSKGLEREAYDRQVVAVLNERRVELVCLAGYMRLLSPYFVAAFPRPNPEYPSLAAALLSGTRSAAAGAGLRREVRGCTVHFVDENLDAGPIMVQAIVPVKDGDDEARRWPSAF